MARSDHESSGEAPTVPVLSNIEQTAKTRASRLVISQSLYPARRKRPLGKSGPSAGLLSLLLTVSRPCADWREMAGWSSSNSDTVWLLLLRRKIQACASSRVARSGSYPEPLCNPFQTWPAHFNDFPYLRPATLCWLSRIEESNARFPQFEGARGSGLAEARAHSPRPGWSSLDNEPVVVCVLDFHRVLMTERTA